MAQIDNLADERVTLEARLDQLRGMLAEKLPVANAIADVEKKLAAINATISNSANATQVVGNQNVVLGDNAIWISIQTIYTEAADQQRARAELQNYLRIGVWSRWRDLKLMASVGKNADVPLSAVYTALDVTATAGLDEKRILSFAGFNPDVDEIAHLLARVTAELKRMDGQRQEGAHGEELGVDRREKTLLKRPLSAIEAASLARRLVLLGPAGSGKSTFARYLALCMAGEIIDDDALFEHMPAANLRTLCGLAADQELPDVSELAWPHGALVPVYVELRQFVSSAAFQSSPDPGVDSWLAFLKDSAIASEAFLPVLGDILGAGKGLILLDGLDEIAHPHTNRHRLRQVIMALAKTYPRSRILVTSRPYAYRLGAGVDSWRLEQPDFATAELALFGETQRVGFVQHWYGNLARKGQLANDQAARQAANLVAEIERTPHLVELAQRPLMLTMMVDLHASEGGSLPERRADLYERSVELLVDKWNSRRDIGAAASKPTADAEHKRDLIEDLGISLSKIRECLEALAFHVHEARGSQTSGEADIPRLELEAALRSVTSQATDKRPNLDEIMDYLRDRSGILIGDPGITEGADRFHFPHRSYQEYLAACHLTRHEFPYRLERLIETDPILWREVCLLALGRLARPSPFAAWALLSALVPAPPPADLQPTDVRFGKAHLAALALQETESLWRCVQLSDKPKLENIRQWLQQTLELGALSPSDRAASGRVLALLGDERPGVGRRDAGMPDIAWCELPAGTFAMGSEKGEPDSYDRERPRLNCVVEQPFRMSKYPITVAQFRPFVETGGYQNKVFWTDTGWGWRKRDQIAAPRGWDDDQEWHLANHPVTGVSWFEASAYCQWLSRQLGFEGVRLPTEIEWEYAARGTDGRQYPWQRGAVEEHCNMSETGIGRKCAVGMFPLTDGPWGDQSPLDMSGNVWEWCQTAWTGNYEGYLEKQQALNREEGNASRVLRGGSYIYLAAWVRCAFRYGRDPDFWNDDVGFRVVAPI